MLLRYTSTMFTYSPLLALTRSLESYFKHNNINTVYLFTFMCMWSLIKIFCINLKVRTGILL